MDALDHCRMLWVAVDSYGLLQAALGLHVVCYGFLQDFLLLDALGHQVAIWLFWDALCHCRLLQVAVRCIRLLLTKTNFAAEFSGLLQEVVVK